MSCTLAALERMRSQGHASDITGGVESEQPEPQQRMPDPPLSIVTIGQVLQARQEEKEAADAAAKPRVEAKKCPKKPPKSKPMPKAVQVNKEKYVGALQERSEPVQVKTKKNYTKGKNLGRLAMHLAMAERLRPRGKPVDRNSDSDSGDQLPDDRQSDDS